MSLKLEEFLSELISRVRDDKVSNEMTKSLTDLFLMNELEKAGKTPSDLLNDNDMKYYIMGWYVYNSLVKQEN